MSVILCSFSGNLAELPRGKRTALDGLRALSTDPRVSVWERGTPWLERLIADMLHQGLIEDDHSEPYPWCRFTITAAGRAMLDDAQRATGGA